MFYNNSSLRKGGHMVRRELPPCLIICFLLLAFIAAVFALPGCSSRSDDDIVLNVQECADKLLETIAFKDTLTEINEQAITTIYHIAAEDVLEKKVYVSTGATAEEIAVFEAIDHDAAKRVEAAVWQRVDKQKVGFRDYLPKELPKLKDPIVLVKGNYVIFCVSDHKEEVEAELKKLF
jgi:hypothetical protein